MLKRVTIIAALLVAMPVFSASTPTPEQCKNQNSALCLFNTMGQSNNQAGVDAASSLVAMVGSVCALPLRIMSQLGPSPVTANETVSPGVQQ